jgi:aspartyl-tRNA(Asn)/glutamyl-tRNA(Gln) amidotransferase subunit A
MRDRSVEAVAQALRSRRVSALEVTEACLERITRLDAGLHAFITVDVEGALRTARARDSELAAGRPRGPLHGIPLAWKDLFAVPELPTSCGTRTPDYFVPGQECTAVGRLTAAGAVTLGKLNMSELALGAFGENAHHGDVANPWRSRCCAGGSSSGSAVAVASSLALGTLGTDTGGSIRLPAAWCGVVGFKPTYGRVSRAGAMPLSWSNDHLGPIAATVRDAALLLQVVAGSDPADPTASTRPVPDYLAGIEGGVSGLRIARPENYYFDDLDADVSRAVEDVAQALASEGARLGDLLVPDPQPLVDVTSLVTSAECAAIHERVVRERPHELQPVVLARLAVGYNVSAHDYLQALRLRARLTRDFVHDVFANTDLLIVPTTPVPAPVRTSVTAGTVAEIMHRMARCSRLTRPFNGLGLPALTVPCGLSRDGLPLSVQLVGRPFDEATLLRAGRCWERLAGGFALPPLG